MPITPTFPGVYVEELPSGVRTITGVATSTAAFIGGAKRGPIDKAVRVFGFADFERQFGGLARSSEMSYAVRQFFTNGGSQAWIVRVAKSSTAGTKTLKRGGTDVLTITARDAGAAGNNIRLLVDQATSSPSSTFNLTVAYSSPDDPTGTLTENFTNLSMNSDDPRYVETIVNGQSQLVTAKRVAGVEATVAGKGTSRSGPLTTVDLTGLDPAHNQFRISANGSDFVTVTIPGAIDKSSVANFAGALKPVVQGAGVSIPALATMDVAESSGRLVFESAVAGEKSVVRILPGTVNDASVRLKLGPSAGGDETDATGAIRPDVGPLGGSLTGTEVANATLITLPAAGKKSLQISLDGGVTRTLVLDITTPGSASPAALASKLETEIRKLDTSSETYRKFTVTTAAGVAPNTTKLTFRSGTKGSGSTVAVTAVTGDTLATDLGLTGGTATAGADVTLLGGGETDFDPSAPFAAIIASRADRKGLFALEAVDLFNILCLPGIADGPTLAEAAAYCAERRAFMIVDAPPGLKPDAMETTVTGTLLPKTSYAAVYYPWLKVGDPLNGGALRSVAPSGTIAGVYARTDSTRGVWKAPAGTDATLVGVQGADYVLTDRENGILNPRGVNCSRIMPAIGPVAWGARTLRGDDGLADQWKYVPVRRTALFIEESLYRGTQWVVFEPNDEPLWAQIRLNVGAFMQDLFRQGAFQGKTPREAYLVKCDRETTTQNDINLGIVNIIVGFAPLKPAEFVFIKIQQLAGQIQT